MKKEESAPRTSYCKGKWNKITQRNNIGNQIIISHTERCNKAVPMLLSWGPHSRIVGWGTMLQDCRAWVWVPVRSWIFFNLPKSVQPSYGPGVDSASNINEYQKMFMGKRVQTEWKADLTANCPNNAKSTSHNPIGLHGLFQGQMHFFLLLHCCFQQFSSVLPGKSQDCFSIQWHTPATIPHGNCFSHALYRTLGGPRVGLNATANRETSFLCCGCKSGSSSLQSVAQSPCWPSYASSLTKYNKSNVVPCAN
jgi:hypothetical protein